MEIASVGASGAYSNPTIQSARQQPQEDQMRVQQAARPVTEQSVEPTREASGPVRNAEGQETGRFINTTA